MKILTNQNIPRWYNLTINKETGFPCIEIHNRVIENLETLHPRIVDTKRESFGLDPDEFPFHETAGEFFGFGDSLQRISVGSDFTTFRINLPRICQMTDETCTECRGVKKDGNSPRCSYCSGTGKERIISQKEAFSVCASFSLLQRLVDNWQYNNQDHENDLFQILTVSTAIRPGQNSAPITGKFSPHCVDFLRLFSERSSFPEISSLMLTVYRHMWNRGDEGLHSSDMYDTRAEIGCYPANLILDVPGDACGIHPSPYVHEISNGQGDNFTCHNVDTPLQQLTLLTGLAGICDLVNER